MSLLSGAFLFHVSRLQTSGHVTSGFLSAKQTSRSHKYSVVVSGVFQLHHSEAEGACSVGMKAMKMKPLISKHTNECEVDFSLSVVFII